MTTFNPKTLTREQVKEATSQAIARHKEIEVALRNHRDQCVAQSGMMIGEEELSRFKSQIKRLEQEAKMKFQYTNALMELKDKIDKAVNDFELSKYRMIAEYQYYLDSHEIAPNVVL